MQIKSRGVHKGRTVEKGRHEVNTRQDARIVRGSPRNLVAISHTIDKRGANVISMEEGGDISMEVLVEVAYMEAVGSGLGPSRGCHFH